MVGVSAGASFGGKYIGLFGHEGYISAFCSISNPYNFARLSYHLENAFWGKIMSGVIAKGFKNSLVRHHSNPMFKELLKQKDLLSGESQSDFDQAKTCWAIDSVFTYKLGGQSMFTVNEDFIS